MPIKWGNTTVTAVKWGNTNCMTVKWGNTIVFQINGYSNGTFSSPLTGWYKYNTGNWSSISSPSLTFQTYVTSNVTQPICGTNLIAASSVPVSTSSTTKYINVIFDWVLNNPTTATANGNLKFLIYFSNNNKPAPVNSGYEYITSTSAGNGVIVIDPIPTKSTYGISITGQIRAFTPSVDTRITFSVFTSGKYYTSSVNVTVTIKQVNLY